MEQEIPKIRELKVEVKLEKDTEGASHAASY